MKLSNTFKGSLAILALVAAVACDNKSATQQPTVPSTTGAVTTVINDTRPNRDSIPEELKNDAYYYYGLDREQPVDLELRGTGDATRGARTVKFDGMEDGKALFTIEHTGGVAHLGALQYSLEPEGLFSVGLIGGKLDPPHQMEIPAKMTVGTTWSSAGTITAPNGQVSENKLENKIVREEQVSTKAGRYDALVIESTGTSVINGKTHKVSLRSWVTRGVGPVKYVITQSDGTDTVKIELEAVD